MEVAAHQAHTHTPGSHTHQAHTDTRHTPTPTPGTRKGPEAEWKLGGGPQRTPGIRNEWYDLEATSQACFYSEALKKRSNTGIFAFLYMNLDFRSSLG